MMADLHLAAAHHVLVFALVGLIFAELVLVRPGLAGETLSRVTRIDAIYGAVAGLVIIVGVSRVIWGARGWEFYSGNPWFWCKMGAFLIVGLMTIPPTLAYRRWTTASKADPAYVVPEGEIAAARRLIHLQLPLFFLIPIFAAAMARYY